MSSDMVVTERSSDGFTVECKIHFRRGHCGRKRLQHGERPRPAPVGPGRMQRVTKLMALAIRFQRLVSEGAVRDYADLARLGNVTRARMTQIMNLLHLAPDIQEAVLFLPKVHGGHDRITERDVRPICAASDWAVQRRMWRKVCPNR